MRAAYILLALIILLVGALSGALLLVSPSRRQPTPPPRREVVYVDAGQLVSLHPDSKAIAAMKAVVDSVRAGGRWAPSGADLSMRSPSPASSPTPAALPSRQRLEADVAEKAVSALSHLEADQRAALEARLSASRRTLQESARSELTAQFRDVRNDASDKLKALAESHASERVNAQIKIAALGIAKSALKTLTDPMGAQRQTANADSQPVLVKDTETETDPQIAALGAELRSVQAGLGGIIDTTIAKTNAIRAEARQKIASLRAESDARIDSQLAQQEQEGRKRIEGGITVARSEVLRELSLLDKALDLRTNGMASHEPVRVSVTPVGGPGTFRGATVDVRAMDRALLDARARVLADVRDTVRKLAEEKGLRVTFSRGAGISDRTKAFADMLRSDGWGACGPALCPEPG